jgi:hypothetical protein
VGGGGGGGGYRVQEREWGIESREWSKEWVSWCGYAVGREWGS